MRDHLELPGLTLRVVAGEVRLTLLGARGGVLVLESVALRRESGVRFSSGVGRREELGDLLGLRGDLLFQAFHLGMRQAQIAHDALVSRCSSVRLHVFLVHSGIGLPRDPFATYPSFFHPFDGRSTFPIHLGSHALSIRASAGFSRSCAMTSTLVTEPF